LEQAPEEGVVEDNLEAPQMEVVAAAEGQWFVEFMTLLL